MGSVEFPSTCFKDHQPVGRGAYALTKNLDPLLEIPMAVTAEVIAPRKNFRDMPPQSGLRALENRKGDWPPSSISGSLLGFAVGGFQDVKPDWGL